MTTVVAKDLENVSTSVSDRLLVVYSEIRSGHMHHAYILSGSSPEHTLDAARRIHMESICGCGICDACLRSLAGTHPDLLEVQVTGTQILVDQVRYAARAAYLSPSASKRRTIVIPDAQRMNPNAQNAMLKVLEEPPSSTTIVLTVDDPRGLLPTVRSRAVQLSIAGVANKQESTLSDTDREDLVEWLSRGPFNPGRALDAAMKVSDVIKATREHITKEALDEFSGLTKREHDDRLRRKARRVEQDLAGDVLFEVASFARDVLACSFGSTRLIHAERADEIARHCHLPGIRSRTITLCETSLEARRRLEANANVTLVLEWVMLAVSAAFNYESTG